MAMVLISGGTGLIGSRLTRHMKERGFDVVILSREAHPSAGEQGVAYSRWSVNDGFIDAEAVRRADHIIHLAGAGVVEKKWTSAYKKVIVDSRTKSAELIINCLKEPGHNVKTFVSASAIGWYGADPAPLDRNEGFNETDLPAGDFLGETCVAWEASTEPVTSMGIRLVKLRTGIVLSNRGGVLKEYKSPLQFGIAPVLGSGKQVVSWIHIDDLCRLYCEAIENPYLNGSYNAVAPMPVSQKELVVTLGQKMRNRFFIPVNVPALFLKLIFGKRSIEILKSTTVSDRKVKAAGFTFLYPSIDSALGELTKNPAS